MNLTDLQVELRLIEEHIAGLHNEIENMKPKTEEQKIIDFNQITILADKNIVVNDDIKMMSEQTKKLVISSLAYIILQDKNDFYNRILYLTRLAKGSEFNVSAEDIYRYGLEFELKDIDNLIQDADEYKYTYIIESLITVNISENASSDMLSIIADIADMFGISKEELRVLGMAAKSVLIGNMDNMLNMPVPSENIWSGKLTNYLPQKWIEKNRILCERFCVEKYVNMNVGSFKLVYGAKYKKEKACEIIKMAQVGDIVKKGDVICTYKEYIYESQDEVTMILHQQRLVDDEQVDDSDYKITEKTIIAPCNGIVFYINDEKCGESKDNTDKYISIYIVSYFDDYDDFHSWYRKSIRI